jgi:hypothetical protein
LLTRSTTLKNRPRRAVSDAGARDADGQVGLAGPRAADQHEVALLIEEVSGGQPGSEVALTSSSRA